MREVRLVKADPLGDQKIEDTVIYIDDEIPKFHHTQSWETIENYYGDQADKLTDTLFNSLPQGTLDRVLIAFMKRKVSLYRGKTNS